MSRRTHNPYQSNHTFELPSSVLAQISAKNAELAALRDQVANLESQLNHVRGTQRHRDGFLTFRESCIQRRERRQLIREANLENIRHITISAQHNTRERETALIAREYVVGRNAFAQNRREENLQRRERALQIAEISIQYRQNALEEKKLGFNIFTQKYLMNEEHNARMNSEMQYFEVLNQCYIRFQTLILADAKLTEFTSIATGFLNEMIHIIARFFSSEICVFIQNMQKQLLEKYIQFLLTQEEMLREEIRRAEIADIEKIYDKINIFFTHYFLLKMTDLEKDALHTRSEIERYEIEYFSAFLSQFSSQMPICSAKSVPTVETTPEPTMTALIFVNKPSIKPSLFGCASTGEFNPIFHAFLKDYMRFFEKWSAKTDFLSCIEKLKSHEKLDIKMIAYRIKSLFDLYHDAKKNIYPAAKIFTIFNLSAYLINLEKTDGSAKAKNFLEKVSSSLSRKQGQNEFSSFASDFLINFSINKICPNPIFSRIESSSHLSVISKEIDGLTRFFRDIEVYIFSSGHIYKNNAIQPTIDLVLTHIDTYISTLYSILKSSERYTLLHMNLKELLSIDEIRNVLLAFHADFSVLTTLIPREANTKLCYATKFQNMLVDFVSDLGCYMAFNYVKHDASPSPN